jgi:hypothetical protein
MNYIQNKTSELLTDMHKYNSETKEICNKVIEELEKQGQSLSNSDKNMNIYKTQLDSSNKILNDMTWYGWFMSFIPFKGFISRIFNWNKKEDLLFIENKLLRDVQLKNKQNVKVNSKFPILEIIIETDNENDIDTNVNLNEYETKQLKQLEKDLYELKEMNETIGHHLDIHNQCIDKINEKTEIITNKTKDSIIKASHI